MRSSIEPLKKVLQDFFFGAAYLEFEQAAYHSLRLLPYFFPALNSWKMRMLREKDLTEMKSL